MRRLLRFFFHHFYHGFAWSYDAIAALVSIGRWLDWGRAALPLVQGPRVLEIGFGTGHLQVELKRLAFQTFGLDESRQMNTLARARLGRHGLPPGLARGHAQSLPFVSLIFDSVLACFPSEYIFNAQTLAEIRRVLKPGGQMVVIPMAWIGGSSLPDRAAKWLFRITGQAEVPSASLHDRLRPAFEQAGFHVQINQIEIRHSTVVVIQAKKPN